MMAGFTSIRRVNLAFASSILILVFVGALAYRGLDSSDEANRWVDHTHQVLQYLWQLRLDVLNVESNDRRFILTGDEADIDVARAAVASAYQDLDVVRRLTADNPRQQSRVPPLRDLLDQKRQRVDALEKMVKTQGMPAVVAALRTGVGKALMGRTQFAIQQMQDEERRLLALRNAHEQQASGLTKIVLVLGTAMALLITAAAGWTAQRNGAQRNRAEADLREKVAELNRSNEELGNFAHVASHDLQEPLRMVTSYLELLSRRYRGKLDADADEFIAYAVDGARRMQGLIRDLLAYSRVGTTDKIVHGASSEEALARALLNLRSAIAESGAVVTHDRLPKVLADGTQLTQLFQNLIGNAIKYQNPGVPRIHVSAARNDAKTWMFAVNDNGLGIEPQHFEKIFGMFQRLHARDEFSGAGIGLAICKKIVERHGGSISVESQSGQGSTFRFALAGTG